MSYQSKFTGEEIDEAVNEAKALVGKSVVCCSTADVGQIPEVAEVDENGKPTKWRAVNKPSGGIAAPVNGFFTLSVDENGDLWAHCEDDMTLDFEYDSETGDLYVVQEQ